MEIRTGHPVSIRHSCIGSFLRHSTLRHLTSLRSCSHARLTRGAARTNARTKPARPARGIAVTAQPRIRKPLSSKTLHATPYPFTKMLHCRPISRSRRPICAHKREHDPLRPATSRTHNEPPPSASDSRLFRPEGANNSAMPSSEATCPGSKPIGLPNDAGSSTPNADRRCHRRLWGGFVAGRAHGGRRPAEPRASGWFSLSNVPFFLATSYIISAPAAPRLSESVSGSIGMRTVAWQRSATDSLSPVRSLPRAISVGRWYMGFVKHVSPPGETPMS